MKFLTCRRLRDNEPPAFAKEWCCAFGNNGRRSERSDDDTVKRLPEEGITTGNFSPLLYHSNTVLKAAGDHHPLEKIGATLVRIQQDEPRFCPLIGQHKARKPSTGT